MPKAVITNRIYLDSNPTLNREIASHLTYKIKKNIPGVANFINFDIIKTFKQVNPNVMSIPVGRWDLIPADYEIIDKRTISEAPFPVAKFELRNSQIDVHAKVDDNCFINAMVGWGKTFTALHIAKKLGQKTLIVTHNTMLRDQWIEEIEKLFGMHVGIIGSGSMDYEDYPITVGNIQTLSKKEVIIKVAKEFGTVIMDEAHHCPASTFTSFIDAMHARYRIGLSGTMIRKDGRHILFKDYFGPKLLQPPQENTMTPTIEVVKTGRSLLPGETWAKKINDLLYDDDYQEFIVRLTQIQLHKGHVVLVIADRVEFLQRVSELIGPKSVCITGGTDYEERKALKGQVDSGEKTCVVGSRQIVSEGWSVNRLSCVILASPIANAPLLEQVVGRVQREHPDKLPPVVIDLHFAGSADRKQNKERIAFYMRKGWEIKGL